MSKQSKARFRTCGWTGDQGDQDPRKERVDMKEGYRPAVRRREKKKGGGGKSRDSPRPAGRCWVDIGTLASAGAGARATTGDGARPEGLAPETGSSCVRWAAGGLCVSRVSGLMLVRARARSKFGRSDLSPQQASGRALTTLGFQDGVDRCFGSRSMRPWVCRRRAGV